LKKPRFKVRDAFREDFYDHFEKVIQNIENLSTDVLRAATQCTMGEIRQIRYTTEDMAESLSIGQLDVRVALEGISREQADAKYRLEQLRLDREQDREERRLLEHNIQKRIEAFSNNLILQIYTGVRQELLGVAQKSMDDRNLSYNGMLHRRLN
jgi:predicted ATP-dependent endonuclease of OLD family